MLLPNQMQFQSQPDVIDNIVSQISQITGIDFSKIPILTDIDKFLKGCSFGIPNYWWLSLIYLIYLFCTLTYAVYTNGKTFLREADYILFIIWAVLLLHYWPTGMCI